ncbi:helix-turn-helix domain-containing protein [Paenibacillus monticola]|uniref:Helix-turn-helix domain-containing protein n=1 Tax=Paenibacillus monticola TaxID=2666075 RepID=A0A7X2H1R1_9BACL|nr:helix-turn-helix domain-containing protein [Paenibacillus monticola]MRN51957.1 helix-turn-helix domain-containing protein [Paenibacillus monticola]
MNTVDLITAIREDIKLNLREEVLAELQPEIQRQLRANIFDMSDACQYLKISDSTLRKMVKTDEVPYFRQRGQIFFRQISLDGWAASLEKSNKEGVS